MADSGEVVTVNSSGNYVLATTQHRYRGAYNGALAYAEGDIVRVGFGGNAEMYLAPTAIAAGSGAPTYLNRGNWLALAEKGKFLRSINAGLTYDFNDGDWYELNDRVFLVTEDTNNVTGDGLVDGDHLTELTEVNIRRRDFLSSFELRDGDFFIVEDESEATDPNRKISVGSMGAFLGRPSDSTTTSGGGRIQARIRDTEPQASADCRRQLVWDRVTESLSGCFNNPTITTVATATWADGPDRSGGVVEELFIEESRNFVVNPRNGSYVYDRGANKFYRWVVPSGGTSFAWVQTSAFNALQQSRVPNTPGLIGWYGEHDTDAEATARVHSVPAGQNVFYVRNHTLRRMVDNSYSPPGLVIDHWEWRQVNYTPPDEGDPDLIPRVYKLPDATILHADAVIFLTHDYAEGNRQDATLTVGFAGALAGYSDGSVTPALGSIDTPSPVAKIIGYGTSADYLLESVTSLNREFIEDQTSALVAGVVYQLGVLFQQNDLYQKRFLNYPTGLSAATVSINFRNAANDWYFTDGSTIRHTAGLYEDVDDEYRQLISRGLVHIDGRGNPTSNPTEAAQSYVNNAGELYVAGDEITVVTTPNVILSAELDYPLFHADAISLIELEALGDGAFSWIENSFSFAQYRATGLSTFTATWLEVWTYIVDNVSSTTETIRYQASTFIGFADNEDDAADDLADILTSDFAQYEWYYGRPGGDLVYEITEFTRGIVTRTEHFFWKGPLLDAFDVDDLIDAKVIHDETHGYPVEEPFESAQFAINDVGDLWTSGSDHVTHTANSSWSAGVADVPENTGTWTHWRGAMRVSGLPSGAIPTCTFQYASVSHRFIQRVDAFNDEQLTWNEAIQCFIDNPGQTTGAPANLFETNINIRSVFLFPSGQAFADDVAAANYINQRNYSAGTPYVWFTGSSGDEDNWVMRLAQPGQHVAGEVTVDTMYHWVDHNATGGGGADGVVNTLDVTGTTLTLGRSQGLADLTATLPSGGGGGGDAGLDGGSAGVFTDAAGLNFPNDLYNSGLEIEAGVVYYVQARWTGTDADTAKVNVFVSGDSLMTLTAGTPVTNTGGVAGEDVVAGNNFSYDIRGFNWDMMLGISNAATPTLLYGVTNINQTFNNDLELTLWQIAGVGGGGGGGGITTAQHNGTPQITDAATINFIGSAVSGVTNQGSGVVDINIEQGAATVQHDGTPQITDATTFNFQGTAVQGVTNEGSGVVRVQIDQGTGGGGGTASFAYTA